MVALCTANVLTPSFRKIGGRLVVGGGPTGVSTVPVVLTLRGLVWPVTVAEMSFTELGRELGKVWSGMNDKQKAVRTAGGGFQFFGRLRGRGENGVLDRCLVAAIRPCCRLICGRSQPVSLVISHHCSRTRRRRMLTRPGMPRSRPSRRRCWRGADSRTTTGVAAVRRVVGPVWWRRPARVFSVVLCCTVSEADGAPLVCTSSTVSLGMARWLRACTWL